MSEPQAGPKAGEPGGAVAELKITQVKSKIGGTSQQRNSLRSLGLRRIGQTVVKPDRPEFRGMIKAVRHLVTVEEVAQND
jgi:large subunit ribosomal protein L30